MIIIFVKFIDIFHFCHIFFKWDPNQISTSLKHQTNTIVMALYFFCEVVITFKVTKYNEWEYDIDIKSSYLISIYEPSTSLLLQLNNERWYPILTCWYTYLSYGQHFNCVDLNFPLNCWSSLLYLHIPVWRHMSYSDVKRYYQTF